MRIHSPQITGSAANTNIILTTVTSSISVLSASFASTASYWSGSIINAASASYWSGSIINAATASYILNAVSASYVLNAISSSFAETASSADNLTVRGTLTAQTINVQTITSSIDYVTGSSINGSLLSNTHQITGSTSITGSLTVNDSNVILTNQTSSMSVATASYWSGSIINAATASYVQNAISASYALTASYASNVPETASYALQANSASFALTASYISGSGAGVGFPFSGSAVVTGSLFVSGSTISGSFKGDGSQITGLTAGGKIHTQSSAASTWTVSHNLGVQYPNVTVYNASNEVIIPQTITATDANTLTLTFGSAVSGYAVSGIGGIINVQGRTTQQYFAAATTWSFAHNLGDRYVSLQAFDDAFEMMIPTTIRLVDATSSIMLFESASSGYAVATIGGDLPAISSSYAGYTLQVANSAPYSASWVAVPNVTVTTAVSSSFAATASSADNLTVRGTLTAQTINVQTITSSIEFITGSTRNGSIAGNTHQFTGSVLMSGSLTVAKILADTTLDGDPQLGFFTNASTGSSAEAAIYIKNGATTNDATFVETTGTGFTTTGGFVQDGGIVGTGTALAGGLSLMVRANADMRFYTNGHTNERMRIDSTGRVLIAGTGSSGSPIFQIQKSDSTTNSNSYFWNTYSSGMMIKNSDATANTLSPIYFYMGSGNNSIAGIAGIQESSTLGAIGFFTGGSGRSSTVPERMRIDSAGNVAINNTTGTIYTKLSVAGGIAFGNNTDSNLGNKSYGNAFSKQSTVVAGGATVTIKPTIGSEAALILVSGVVEATGNRFSDLILILGAGGTPLVVASRTYLSPATRTYTNGGENLRLQLTGSSETYVVWITGFGGNESL